MISITPRPTLYDEEVRRVRAASLVPVHRLYAGEILGIDYDVPWSVDPTLFVVSTSNPDLLHTIYVNREKVSTLVPGFERVEIAIPLHKGVNHIEIVNNVESGRAVVSATVVGSWFYALGREVSLDVTQRVRSIRESIASPWTSYLSAHLFSALDYLPRAQMPNLQAMRMAMLSLTSRPGYTSSVVDFATALAYSTPYSRELKASDPASSPYWKPAPNTAEHFAGREFNLWFSNLCLSYWGALFRLAHNLGSEDTPLPKPIELIDVSDSQLLLKFMGGEIESHFFDPLGIDCVLSDDFIPCGGTTSVYVEFTDVFDIAVSSPQLPLDTVVENPLGFGFFDRGVMLDQGSTLDTVDPDDPFGDGFFGVSLSGGLDSGLFDSMTQRARRLSQYVYPIASPSSATPEGRVVGVPLNVVRENAHADPPPALAGDDVFWASCVEFFTLDGDWVRLNDPNLDVQVLEAKPVLHYTTKTTGGEYTRVGRSQQLRVPIVDEEFFTPSDIGRGVRVINGGAISGDVTILDVFSQGGYSVAVVVGRDMGQATVPGLSLTVYEPLRDTSSGESQGRRVFELKLASPLPRSLTNGESLDLRRSPRVYEPTLAGASEVLIATDVEILPGDELYYSPTASSRVYSAYPLSPTTVCPVSRLRVWRVLLSSSLPVSFSSNYPLYTISAGEYRENGAPVTPLAIFSMEPEDFIRA